MLEEDAGVHFLDLKNNLNCAKSQGLPAAAVEVATNLVKSFESAYERARANSQHLRDICEAIEKEEVRLGDMGPSAPEKCQAY